MTRPGPGVGWPRPPRGDRPAEPEAEDRPPEPGLNLEAGGFVEDDVHDFVHVVDAPAIRGIMSSSSGTRTKSVVAALEIERVRPGG